MMAGLRVLVTYVFVCGVQSNVQFGYFHKVDVKRLGFQRWTHHGVVSYVRCATRCVSDDQCLSFQYNPLTGVCTGNNVSQGNSQAFGEIVDTGNCIFDPVEVCSEYGLDMTKYPGLGISGHNTINYFGLTPEECVTACVTQTTYVCVSTDMKLSDGRCSLQEVGYLDVNVIDRETEEDGWVFSTRNCAA